MTHESTSVEGGAGASRRQALRTAVAGVAAVVGGGLLTVGAAAPASAAQQLWRWCRRCSGLWFSGNSTRGRCPAGDGGHDSTGSGNYILKEDQDGGRGQSGWRWCADCQGLWFSGRVGYGTCPAGGGHWSIGPYPVTSALYRLEDIGNRDGPGGQEQWRFCAKCFGLFFDGNSPGVSGVCPRDHAHHSITGSGNYLLRQV
ncbi:hypothetical protein [Streptomyces sp. NPDC093094]|uniref:hypothetical protein n=1 Tax=Streptomyces sp. NPDC093094 TaxID=3366026 RepID=UPI003814E45A